MRMAIYHPWVYLTSGIERSFVELLRRSRHEWVIWTHHHRPEATYPELAAYDVRELAPRVSVRRSFGPLVHAASTIYRARLPERGVDAMLVSSEGLGDLVLHRAALPAAAYCHTPLKIVHDPATRAALVAADRRKALALAGMAPAFEWLDRRMWRRYRHVFVNSEETRQRCAAARLVGSGPTEVLRPGVDLARYHPDGRPREPLLLVAGRIMWQKNIELAVDAVRLLAEAGCAARLVVAGAVDEKSRPYLAALRDRAAGLDVRFEADPTDQRLVELYRRCAGLVFTARNEDFGIVPLEAMACGAPVVAVDAGGPRETVLPGRTGWLLPADPADFASRLRELLAMPGGPPGMAEAAVARAAEFGWDPFVTRIDDVLEELARERPA